MVGYKITIDIIYFSLQQFVKLKEGISIYLLKFAPTMQANSFTESSEANFRPYLQQNVEAA